MSFGVNHPSENITPISEVSHTFTIPNWRICFFNKQPSKTFLSLFLIVKKKKSQEVWSSEWPEKNVGFEVSSTITGNIPDTHQRLAQKCWLSNLQNVCGCLVACLSRWKGANLIFLTGLRLAAMNVRHAWSKHILFIGLFLMCQEQTSSHQRLLTAGFHYYCTNTSLMICLSSAELWK